MSSSWLAKEALVLEQVETDNYVQLLSMRHLQQSASIAAGSHSPEIYKQHADGANKRYSDVGRLLIPYLSGWSGGRKGHLDKLRQSRAEYEAVFGKLEDPRVIAEVRRLQDRLTQEAREGQAAARQREWLSAGLQRDLAMEHKRRADTRRKR